MYCENCGTILKNNENFCGRCGAKVGGNNGADQSEKTPIQNYQKIPESAHQQRMEGETLYYGPMPYAKAYIPHTMVVLAAENVKNVFRNGLFLTALICYVMNLLLQLLASLMESDYGQLFDTYFKRDILSMLPFMVTLIISLPSVFIMIGLWSAYLQSAGGLKLARAGNTIRWVVMDICLVILAAALLLLGVMGSKLLRRAGYYIRGGNETVVIIMFAGIIAISLLALIYNLYYAKLNRILRGAESMMNHQPVKIPAVMYVSVIWVLLAILNLFGMFVVEGIINKIRALVLAVSYILFTVWLLRCKSELESLRSDS